MNHQFYQLRKEKHEQAVSQLEQENAWAKLYDYLARGKEDAKEDLADAYRQVLIDLNLTVNTEVRKTLS